MKTLADRLIDAMKGPPKVTGVALAKACRVAPPSVSGWRTGDSKTLEGSNLLAAAAFLGVNAKWLADGMGPRYPDHPQGSAAHVARATPTEFHVPNPHDEWIEEAIRIMLSLKPRQRPGAVANLRTYVDNLHAPPNPDAIRQLNLLKPWPKSDSSSKKKKG